MIVPREFFGEDTLSVARNLLGQRLVSEMPDGRAAGVIVETEAYLGEKDDAAHSYKGKSERVRVQYGPAGMAYIYMIYGMYDCLNITSGPLGLPEVVLIRALEPVEGIGLMARRRKTDKPMNLCSGPGKLCRALGIDRRLYGTDMCREGPLYVEAGWQPERIEASKRVGIDYAVQSRDELWRFAIAGNPYVSGKGRRVSSIGK